MKYNVVADGYWPFEGFRYRRTCSVCGRGFFKGPRFFAKRPHKRQGEFVYLCRRCVGVAILHLLNSHARRAER